jgi:hypothetical protein
VKTGSKLAVAAAAGLALAIGTSHHERMLKEVQPGQFTADQVTVLDAFGATKQQVKDVRHAGRTPICWATAENRKLCADKGFTYYVVWAGSAGS